MNKRKRDERWDPENIGKRLHFWPQKHKIIF